MFESRGEEVVEEIRSKEEENMEVENEAGDIEGDGIECIEIDSDT